MTDRPPDDRIVLDNDALRIELDARDGRFRRIWHKGAGLDLIQEPTGQPPWRLELAGQDGWREGFVAFDPVTVRDARTGQTAILRWTTGDGLTVRSTVTLPAGHAAAEITVRVTGEGATLDKIEYPILGGIGDLTDRADTLLAHPQGTGFLFRRPRDLFAPAPLRRQGLRYSPYPEGFSGSSMQFMSYYAEGVGGFYLAAHDGGGAMKWLNVWKDASEELVATFMHQAPDLSPGNGYDVPYPIVIAALEGTWYAAADRYKQWAVTQPWTARGTLAARQDTCGWLLDEVGFATFGVNAARDRAAWLDRFHRITDAPVFHILGVNWPKRETGYGRGHPGGRGDWFPARFDNANLAMIAANGDYWAPFEFDLLLDDDGDEGEVIAGERLRLPDEKYSFDAYRFPFMCPASERGFLPALHRWRDETLVRDYGADALYYDISANNVLMACRDPAHGHPVGGGGWMVDAYRRMWAGTREATTAAKGATVPQGAEMISELFIPSLDFYQARAEASPLSSFEADFFRDWIRSGWVEKIPLFAYVYHEYGPVRLDGWGKLAAEAGDLFYWTAARVALWGGLFELNYEFSPLETLDGADEDVAEHYADIAPQSFAVAPAKVAFVREIATARTGFAHDYLVYGTMVRPLDLDRYQTRLALDYRLYNVARAHRTFDERGTMSVEAIVHAAWRAPDGKLGFLFINLDHEPRRLDGLTIPLDRYGLSPDQRVTARLVTGAGSSGLTGGTSEIAFDLTLESRTVTLVEIVPGSDVARTGHGGTR